MLTIADLEAYGVDVETGLKRCVNKESLYLRLVGTVPGNEGFKLLDDAIDAGDLDAAFQAAHGLKGAVGNLALTPLQDLIVDMTEHLRNKDDIDYKALAGKINEQRAALEKLCDNS